MGGRHFTIATSRRTFVHLTGKNIRIVSGPVFLFDH